MSDWTAVWQDRFQPAFWKAKHAMTNAADAVYRRHGVRQGQQYILMCLWGRDGQTPGEIAATTGLATPTVTRSATRMAAAGLLRREAHPRDRRLVLIRLTDEGRRLHRVLDDEMTRLTDRALAGLDATEREAFTRMLGTVRENLSAER